MNDDLTVIYRTDNVLHANLLKQWLAEQEIESHVMGDALGTTAGGLHSSGRGDVQVFIPAEDAARAQEMVADFESSLTDAATNEDLTDDLVSDEPSESLWQDWPGCAQCGKRRQAVCPSCEQAGEDIPLAEFFEPTEERRPIVNDSEPGGEQNPAEQTDILLMCPQCDEAFAPRFYRLCAWCGHDHGFGVTVEDDNRTREPRNSRMVAVIAGLGLLGIGFLVYFWLLLG